MIGFIDSGLGGLSILKETIKILPNASYIYYADNKNNPYGNKNINDLEIISKNIVEYLISKGCKIIVLACTTLSTNVLNYLKKEYKNITFISTIPSLDKINIDKKTLFIATKATCNSTYIRSYQDELNILEAPLLASLIEKQNQREINNYLNILLKDYKDKNINKIILGCTHYKLIENEFKKYFKEIEIIDFSKEVSSKVKEVYKENNNYSLTIYNSKRDKSYNDLCLSIIK